ncbi:MAG: fibronectin type III domain-containing protein [Aeromicrobium sp.]
MRRSLVAMIVGLLVVTGLQVQPASAASKKPAAVGLVSFVKAGYVRGDASGTLSIDWPDAKRADKYEIFVSKSYSMSKAKLYKSRSSKYTIKKLTPGRDYFVQVRAVNGKKRGTKSTRVGHAAIVRPGLTSNALRLRVMTYNVCSDVCDTSVTTRYPWASARQPGAIERMTAANPDIIATQEAGKLNVVPPGYTQAFYKSAKRLFFRTSRFDVAPATTPAPIAPPNDKNGCSATYAWGQPQGYIFLGRHSKGCRYATWTELVDKATGKGVFVVNVHTVSGDTAAATASRAQEIHALLDNVKRANTKRLPVIYAGDFNSHKNSSNDVVRPIMKSKKLYDSFDLARTLTNQHVNSFNSFRVSPRIGYKWGDHLDKVWVDPWTTRIDAWYNTALIGADGLMVKPIPSDHSPVVVDLRIG